MASTSNAPGSDAPIWSWRQAGPDDVGDAPSGADGDDNPGRFFEGLHANALEAAETPDLLRYLMLGVLVLLGLLGLGLVFVPWQQTISGSGEVTSFIPGARPRVVQSQIPARITDWRVVEGQHVSAGDTLALLEDISPSYMDNRFVERIATSSLNELRMLRLETDRARQDLRQSRERMRAARAARINANNEVATARTRHGRIELLYEDGLRSLRDYESAQLALQQTRSDSVAAASNFASAQQAVTSAEMAVESRENTLESRRSELDLRVENAQERQNASVVLAPTSGVIARLKQLGPGQTVSEGGQLALIAPETTDQAAELFVSSRDAALINEGRRVQLQFAGFPALLFSGFPELSTGIFSGRVRMISPVADSTGRYRLLVVPDTTDGRPDWPDQSFLRQGSAATGWVMLENVSVGYEIWRRINGLPPKIPVRSRNTMP